MMWFWLLKWVLAGPVVRWYARPRLVGAERIPATGPVVLAPNHLAEIDSLVLSLVIGRRLTFIAKREYFDGSGLRGRLDRWLCTVTGQIPVDRSGGEAAGAALSAARGVLAQGRVWCVYPEGTRSPDGRLHRGHTGAVRVALASPGVVVLPVGISGSDRVDPAGRRGWRRGRVLVRIGPPLDLNAYDADDPADWRTATDRLVAAIGDLTGQEYVDRYPTAAELRRRDQRR
jgi:1-acyl-sn-glycerol-3-phosphate acyltransferase